MAVQVRLARFFPYRLSLFGRALLLLSLELLANAALWIVAGILFAGKHAVGRGDSGDEDRDDADRRSLLSLAVLAWVRSLCALYLYVHSFHMSHRRLVSDTVNYRPISLRMAQSSYTHRSP